MLAIASVFFVVAWTLYAVYSGVREVRESEREYELQQDAEQATSIDVRTASRAVSLVRALTQARALTADQLAGCLVRIYQRFPPQELTLRAMTSEYELFAGTGGETEFAVSTVFGAMKQAMEETATEEARASTSTVESLEQKAPCQAVCDA